MSSCDFSSCTDDIGFVDNLMQKITEEWCIDLEHLHMSGISLGGMFQYYIASRATDGLGNSFEVTLKKYFKLFVIPIRYCNFQSSGCISINWIWKSSWRCSNQLFHLGFGWSQWWCYPIQVDSKFINLMVFLKYWQLKRM